MKESRFIQWHRWHIIYRFLELCDAFGKFVTGTLRMTFSPEQPVVIQKGSRYIIVATGNSNPRISATPITSPAFNACVSMRGQCGLLRNIPQQSQPSEVEQKRSMCRTWTDTCLPKHPAPWAPAALGGEGLRPSRGAWVRSWTKPCRTRSFRAR